MTAALDTLPIFLVPRGRHAVLAGGGAAAFAKARILHRTGADLMVVAESIEPDFDEFLQDRNIRVARRSVRPADFDGAVFAVIAADADTANTDTASAIAQLARRAGVPVNVVDRPDLCDFILPAIVDRSPLLVAVSSGGASPVLARLVRARIESLLPAKLGRLARLAGIFRHSAHALLANAAARRRFWEQVLDGDAGGDLIATDDVSARRAMTRALARAANQGASPPGTVHLVGAGPGDPDLLTMKAFRLLQAADVILYDHLVDSGVLDLARRDARRIFVGTGGGGTGTRQDDINELMLFHANAGRGVVRLKGGDPAIFGRAGEEAAFLRGHGITVHITPGVTAASGCAAAAGIPLTQRGLARSVRFLTGHRIDQADDDADWRAYADPECTTVVYMGRRPAAKITERLIAAGLSADTPALAIENGTRESERRVAAPLDEIAGALAAADFTGPTMLIIGRVADRVAALPASEAPHPEQMRAEYR